MSATIDEKVVQMKFDNSNFEKNVKTSMTTLEKLQDALKFDNAKNSVDKLNNATKSIDFSSMSNSIDSISDRFSAMGIVGMTVIQNLTNSALNLAKSWASIVPDAIIKGGWKRATDVEQAKFTLQGIISDQSKVTELMDAAKESVNDTAYAYNEAAKAASVFAASGVDNGEDMLYILKGVAGTAATANAEYDRVAHIFQKISGQGRIMGEELNQFASLGLNVAATMADYFGTTEAEIREMVSDGQVSFELFAEAMTETFGEHAKDANKTFNGAMANIRAALARTGEAFFKHLIVQEGPLVQLFNSIRVKINQMNTVLDSSAESAANFVNGVVLKIREAVENFPMMTVMKTVINIFQTLGNLLQPIIQILTAFGKAFSDAFDFGSFADTIFTVSENIKNLTKNFKLSEKNVESMRFAFKGLFDVVSLVFDIFGKLISINLGSFTNPLSVLLDIILNIAGTIGLTFTKIVNGIRQSSKIMEIIKYITWDLDLLNDELNVIKKAFSKGFEKLGINIGSVTKSIADFISKLAVGSVERFLSVILAIADAFAYFADCIAGPIAKAITFVFNSISTGYENFKKFAKETDLASKALDALTTVLKVIAGVIVAPILLIWKLVEAISKLPIVQQIGEKVSSAFEKIGDSAIKYLSVAADNLWKFIDYLSKIDTDTALEDLANAFDNIKNKIKGFIDKASEGTGIIAAFADAIKKAWENFKLLTGGVSAHTLYDEYEEPIEEATTATSVFSTIIENAKNMLKDFFKNLDLNTVIVGVFAVTMIGAVLAIWKLVKSFTNMTKSISGVAGAITGFVNSWKRKEQSKIVDFAKAILVLAASLFIISKIDPERLTKSLLAMGAMATGLVIFGFVLSKVAKSIKKNNASKEMVAIGIAMLGLSVGITILAAALKIMETIDPDKILRSVLTLAALGTIVTVLAIALTKFSGAGGLKAAIVIVALALSLSKMAEGLEKITQLDFSNIEKHLKTFIVIFGMLALVAFAASKMGIFSAIGVIFALAFIDKIIPTIKKIIEGADYGRVFDDMCAVIRKNIDVIIAIAALVAIMIGITGMFGKGISKFGLGMILMSVSLVILTKAIDIMGKMDASKVEQGTNAILKIMAAFAVLALILGISRGANGAAKIALSIGIMVACIYPLAGAIWILGTMDANKVQQGLDAVLKILALFAAIVAASRLGNGKTTFGAIMAIVIGILGLVAEMAILTLIPTDRLEASMVSIIAVMAAFAGVLAAASQISNMSGKSLVVLLEMIIILAEIGAALYFLSEKPWEGMLAASFAIALVLVSLGETMNILSKINWEKALASGAIALIFLSVALVPISAYLTVLSQNDWQGMLSGALSIAIVLLALGESVKLMKDTDWKSAIAGAVSCFILSLSLLTISMALYSLAGQPWDGMLAAAISMAIVILALGKTVDIMYGVDWKDAIGAAASCLILSLALLPIAFALWILAEQPWDGMLAASVSMSLVLLALGVVARIVSGLNPGAAIQGALALVAFVAIVEVAFIAMAALMGWLFGNEGIANLLMTGMDALVLIAQKLGETIGAFVGGVIGGAGMTILEDFGKGLTKFAEASDPFFQWVKTIDDTVIEGIKKLGLALIIFGASELVAAIETLVGMTGLLTIPTQMKAMGKGMASFQKATEDVDIDKVMKAAEAATALFSVPIPTSGGLLNAIMGEKKFQDFNWLSLGKLGFGGGIKSFAKAVEGVTPDMVQGGIAVANTLFSLEPNNQTGGLISWFYNNNLSNFNWANLGKLGFGGGIRAFANAVKDVTTDGIEPAIKIANTLFNFEPKNQTGGLLAVLYNNNLSNFNWATLGKLGFGGGIKSFANAVKDVEITDGVTNSISLIEKIFALRPPFQGGLLTLLINNKLSNFNKKKLGEKGLGGGIAAFINEVSGFSEETVGIAKSAAEALQILSNVKMPKTGGLLGALNTLFTGKADAEKFQDRMTQLGGGINAFYEGVKEIDPNKVAIGVSSLVTILALFSKISAFDASKLENFVKKMNSVGNLGIKGFLDAFANADKDIQNACDTLITKFANGLSSSGNVNKIQNSMSSVVGSVYKNVGNNTGQISYDYGYDGMRQYSRGMNDGGKLAINTSDAVSSDIYENFNDQLNYGNFYNMSDEEMMGGLTDGLDVSSYEAILKSGNISDDMYSQYTDTLNYDNFYGMVDKGMFGGMMDSMDANSAGIVDASGILSGNVLGQYTDKINYDNFSGMATNALNGAADTFSGGYSYDNLMNKADGVGKVVKDTIGQYVNTETGEGIGNNFLGGLWNALKLAVDDNGQYNIGETCASIGTRMLSRLEERLQINSPSRKAFEVGEYFIQGLAKGVADDSAVIESIDSTASDTADTLEEAMMGASDYISENMDLNPVITPVLDLSNITSQMGAFNSLFDQNHGIGVYGEIGGVDATNSDVVASIDSLRTDLASLTRVVGNLQVVMDTGTLVGAIAPNMDMALGSMATYRERGMA